MRFGRTLVIVLASTVICPFFSQENIVEVNLTTQKFIGKESKLDRKKYFSMHDSYQNWDLASDADYLFETLGIEFGRAFSGPGPFRNTKDNTLPSTHRAEELAAKNYKNIENAPMYEKFVTKDIVITDHPRDAYQLNQNHEDVAKYNVAYLKKAYPVMPKYYEVINEPFVHSIDYVGSWDETQPVVEDMCYLHKAVADKVHAEIPEIMVGGYASAYPEVERLDFTHWNTRMKPFMDIAGESMQFFATHIYDGRNVTGGYTKRSGSNSEAILDIIEAYSYVKWKKIKPHLISEYGFTAQGLTDNKPYSEELNGICLVAYNRILMSLLDKPDRMLKAVPFITAKASWFYNSKNNPNKYPYPWVIKKRDADGSYTFTHLKKFYELWKDVNGNRIDITSNNPDIQVHAFQNETKTFIAINNLTEEAQPVNLRFLNNSDQFIKNTTLRRLYNSASKVPKLVYFTDLKTVDDLVLKAGETVILECDVEGVKIENTIVEKNFYSNTYLQRIEADKELVFNFSDVDENTEGRAFIRMGLSRKHHLSKEPEVTVNGNPVEVPSNWAGYDQKPRDQFFGVIYIPVDVKFVKAGNNEVKITFQENGGQVSSVILNQEIYK
ncbi:beta-agarase [uncultured Polaribacter sp.]|uniref:beta-agarase n=1 Tax=uncultured Polaribacter sp. TaxID=174711 RepID=UPI002621A7F4|nr:beta-agarase [uncultured Polaribacter sp.]